MMSFQRASFDEQRNKPPFVIETFVWCREAELVIWSMSCGLHMITGMRNNSYHHRPLRVTRML